MLLRVANRLLRGGGEWLPTAGVACRQAVVGAGLASRAVWPLSKQARCRELVAKPGSHVLGCVGVVRHPVVPARVQDAANFATLARAFDKIVAVAGSVSFRGTDITAVSSSIFPRLRAVTENVEFSRNKVLASVSGFDALEGIGGGLTVDQNPKLESVGGFDALRKIGGDITVQSNCELASVVGFGALEKIGGGITLDNYCRTVLELGLGFDSLTEIGGGLRLRGFATRNATVFPALRQVRGALQLYGGGAKLELPQLAVAGSVSVNSAIVSLPSLHTVANELALRFKGAGYAVELPGLTNAGSVRVLCSDQGPAEYGRLYCPQKPPSKPLVNSHGPATLALPSLHTVAKGFIVAGCGGLQTLHLPALASVEQIDVKSIETSYSSTNRMYEPTHGPSAGSFVVSRCHSLQKLFLPAVTSMTGSITMTGESCGNRFRCYNNWKYFNHQISVYANLRLTTISMPGLVSVAGSIALSRLPYLQDVGLQALRSVKGSFTMALDVYNPAQDHTYAPSCTRSRCQASSRPAPLRFPTTVGCGHSPYRHWPLCNRSGSMTSTRTFTAAWAAFSCRTAIRSGNFFCRP